jgi:AcrR family transcriptional regulator
MSDEPSFEDLTARARIRDAALKLFAEKGFRGTTIRDIALTAGVSPALARHHYGSKEELRQACDDYVLTTLRRVSEQVVVDDQMANPIVSRPARGAVSRLQTYVTRSLIDGSASAAAMFDDAVKVTEQWLAREDAARAVPPSTDARTRAALIIAMKLGIPLLHEHLSRNMGVGAFEPEGDRRIVRGLLDIFSHPLIRPELASDAEAGFAEPTERPPANPPPGG